MARLTKDHIKTAVVFGVEVIGVRRVAKGRQQQVVIAIAVDVAQRCVAAIDGQTRLGNDFGDAWVGGRASIGAPSDAVPVAGIRAAVNDEVVS